MTTISKAMLLLAPGDQGGGAGFREALKSAASALRAKLAPGEQLRLSFQIAENPLGGTAHDAVARPEKFEAVVELTSPSADPGSLGERLAVFTRACGNALALDQSAAITGTEHTISPGRGAIRSIFLLRRLPNMTKPAFHDYWLTHHAVLAKRIVGDRAYFQFHGDADATARTVAACKLGIGNYDGVAHGCYTSFDQIRALMSQPEVAKEAFVDEQRFIDHSRSVFMLFDEV